MSEYERTFTVGVSPENAFRYLSSVSNLPNFVPYLRQIREEEHNHVFGTAECEGSRFEVSGFFRADQANHRLDWESDGSSGYKGWLQIAASGPEQSRITIHLSIHGNVAHAKNGMSGEQIERDLETTTGKLRELLEREATVFA